MRTRQTESGVRKVQPGPLVRWKGCSWLWRTLDLDWDNPIHGSDLVGHHVRLYRLTTPYTRYVHEAGIVSDWSRTTRLSVSSVDGDAGVAGRVCGYFVREDMCLTEGL